MKRIFLFALLIASCANPAKDPCTIPQNEQNGPYSVIFEELEGTCGPIGEVEVELEDGVIYPNENLGCEEPNTMWWRDKCKTKAVFKCDDGSWKTKMTWNILSDPENPKRIYGSLTTEMSRFGGIYTCISVYHLEGSRVD